MLSRAHLTSYSWCLPPPHLSPLISRTISVVLMTASSSTQQDFITTSLPFFLFWDMALPRRQKTALGAIFALGFLLCIIGIVRFWYIYKVFFVSYDVTC